MRSQRSLMKSGREAISTAIEATASHTETRALSACGTGARKGGYSLSNHHNVI
jgi:hypothetical protein